MGMLVLGFVGFETCFMGGEIVDFYSMVEFWGKNINWEIPETQQK
jgi:hypothetical protein